MVLRGKDIHFFGSPFVISWVVFFYFWAPLYLSHGYSSSIFLDYFIHQCNVSYPKTHTHHKDRTFYHKNIHIGLGTICLILKRTVFPFLFPLKKKLERLYKINRLTKGNLKHLSCISLCCRVLLSKPSSIFSESLLLFHPHQDLKQTISQIKKDNQNYR